MDNFFKFIDMLDELILVLYDKNFFYTNHHLLTTLGFTPDKRPVSLKQIIELNWLTYIKALSLNDKTEIPLLKKNGDEKKYVAQIYPFQFEQSDFLCFLLKTVDEFDQEFETINWIVENLPLPVIVFDKGDKVFRVNNAFEMTMEDSVENFNDLKNYFTIKGGLDFTKQDFYSFPSPKTNEQVLYLLQHTTKTSETFLIGIILKKNSLEKGQENDSVKKSFIQSIQNLQKLNGSDEKFSPINWKEIDNEINNLKQVFRQLEMNNSISPGKDHHQIDLYKTITNELEILKSNDVFKKKVNLKTNIKSKFACIKGDYSKGVKIILSLIDRSVEEVCNHEIKNLSIDTFAKGEKVYLKIHGNETNGKSDLLMKYDFTNKGISLDKKTNILEDIKKYKKQFQNMEVQFNFNEDSKEYLDLTLIFSID